MRNRPFGHRLPRDLGLLFGLLLVLVAIPAAAAQTLYVTDRVVAGLYPTPRAVGTPLQQLPTGTMLQVLGRRGDFVHVRTPENREGWMAARQLQAELPAQVLLISLAGQQQRTTAALDTLHQQLTQCRSDAREERQVSRSWWMFFVVLVAVLAGFAIGVMWLDWRLRERHGGFRV